jgi:hypothetical protein
LNLGICDNNIEWEQVDPGCQKGGIEHMRGPLHIAWWAWLDALKMVCYKLVQDNRQNTMIGIGNANGMGRELLQGSCHAGDTLGGV